MSTRSKRVSRPQPIWIDRSLGIAGAEFPHVAVEFTHAQDHRDLIVPMELEPREIAIHLPDHRHSLVIFEHASERCDSRARTYSVISRVSDTPFRFGEFLSGIFASFINLGRKAGTRCNNPATAHQTSQPTRFLRGGCAATQRGQRVKDHHCPGLVDQQPTKRRQDQSQVHWVADDGIRATGDQFMSGKQLCSLTGGDKVHFSQSQPPP